MGGILVLFIYVTSLSSNEIFTFSIKLIIIFTLSILFFIIISLLLDKIIVEPFFNNLEIPSFSILNPLINENILSLNKLYNFPTNLITILLINYLFLTLLVTVKITKKNYGPLRPIN